MCEVSVDAFRQAMRRFAASVSIITVGRPGHRLGITATAVCSLTAEPPQILSCVNRSSPIEAVIRETRRFAINMLGSHQRAVADVFSGVTGHRGEQRFLQHGWHDGDHGVPVLDDAPAVFQCDLVTAHPTSTHSILVGRVVDVRLEGSPSALIYQDGAYGMHIALNRMQIGA